LSYSGELLDGPQAYADVTISASAVPGRDTMAVRLGRDEGEHEQASDSCGF